MHVNQPLLLQLSNLTVIVYATLYVLFSIFDRISVYNEAYLLTRKGDVILIIITC